MDWCHHNPQHSLLNHLSHGHRGQLSWCSIVFETGGQGSRVLSFVVFLSRVWNKLFAINLFSCLSFWFLSKSWSLCYNNTFLPHLSSFHFHTFSQVMNNTTFGRGTKKWRDLHTRQLTTTSNNSSATTTFSWLSVSRKIEIECKPDIRGRDIDINIASSHLTDSIT